MALENTDLGDPLIQGDLRSEGMELLTREEPALRRVIMRYVKDLSTTDDLFQDISLKVLRRFHTVRDRRTVRGWIFKSRVIHAWITCARKSQNPMPAISLFTTAGHPVISGAIHPSAYSAKNGLKRSINPWKACLIASAKYCACASKKAWITWPLANTSALAARPLKCASVVHGRPSKRS